MNKGPTALGYRRIGICMCAGVMCRDDIKARKRVTTGGSLSDALSSSCQL